MDYINRAEGGTCIGLVHLSWVATVIACKLPVALVAHAGFYLIKFIPIVELDFIIVIGSGLIILDMFEREKIWLTLNNSLEMTEIIVL